MISQTEIELKNPIEVLKFGGSSLATPEKIIAAAECIHARVKQGHHIIAIVSAMGSTTNDLNALAREVSHTPSRRELDMLISAGERISMALICMALHELECPAISFTGSQAGVLTSGNHSDSEIVDLKPIRVVEALQKNQVAVVAGFQGVNPNTKEITTLGRGGSDITAIAFAHHFKGQFCRFIKDVPGIQPVDPKWVKNNTVYPEISLEQLQTACEMGAKVLNPRALEMAKQYEVNLKLGALDVENQGTGISPQLKGDDHPILLSVLPSVFELSEKAFQQMNPWLDSGELPRPLNIYHNQSKTYLATHPDHLDFFKSKLRDKKIKFTRLQSIAVVFSKETQQFAPLESINDIHIYNWFFHKNMWVGHWDDQADLKDCAQMVFQRTKTTV